MTRMVRNIEIAFGETPSFASPPAHFRVNQPFSQTPAPRSQSLPTTSQAAANALGAPCPAPVSNAPAFEATVRMHNGEPVVQLVPVSHAPVQALQPLPPSFSAVPHHISHHYPAQHGVGQLGMASTRPVVRLEPNAPLAHETHLQPVQPVQQIYLPQYGPLLPGFATQSLQLVPQHLTPPSQSHVGGYFHQRSGQYGVPVGHGHIQSFAPLPLNHALETSAQHPHHVQQILQPWLQNQSSVQPPSGHGHPSH